MPRKRRKHPHFLLRHLHSLIWSRIKFDTSKAKFSCNTEYAIKRNISITSLSFVTFNLLHIYILNDWYSTVSNETLIVYPLTVIVAKTKNLRCWFRKPHSINWESVASNSPRLKYFLICLFVHLHPFSSFRFSKETSLILIHRYILDSFDQVVDFHLADFCPTSLQAWCFELQRGPDSNFRLNYLLCIDTRYLRSCTPPFSELGLCKFKLFARVKLKTCTDTHACAHSRYSRFVNSIISQIFFSRFQRSVQRNKNNYKKTKKRIIGKCFGIARKIFRQHTAIKQTLAKCCVNIDQILTLGIRIIAKRNVDSCWNVLDTVCIYRYSTIKR